MLGDFIFTWCDVPNQNTVEILVMVEKTQFVPAAIKVVYHCCSVQNC